MLTSKLVVATIAVKDLNTARIFYESKLGYRPWQTDDANFVTYKSGPSHFLVYRSEFAGGYKATVATWGVGKDIEAVVKDLKDKGVPFLQYPMLGMKLSGDIHIMGSMKTAWCHDPDGNILCLVNDA